MQRIIFLSPGRTKSSWIADGIKQYVTRLGPVLDLKLMDIPASKEMDERKHAEDESGRLLEKIGNLEGDFWLLDERGKGMTSMQFSELLETAKDAGRTLIFIMGGAYGVTDDFRKAIPNHIRLSDMTFPHELAQVVFLEQVYRALEISKGSGYHH